MTSLLSSVNVAVVLGKTAPGMGTHLHSTTDRVGGEGAVVDLDSVGRRWFRHRTTSLKKKIIINFSFLILSNSN